MQTQLLSKPSGPPGKTDLAESAWSGGRVGLFRLAGKAIPAQDLSISGGVDAESGIGGKSNPGLFCEGLSGSRAVSRRAANPGTWLMQIAVNVLRNHMANGRLKFWRRALRTGLDFADLREWIHDRHSSPEDLALAKEQVQATWKTAGGLSERQTHRLSAALCGGFGPPGNCGHHRNEGRNGEGPSISRPAVDTGQARGKKMNQHLSSKRINYLMSEVTFEETVHARGCDVCRTELARLESSLLLFRGAVRRWSAAVARMRSAVPDDHLARLLPPATLDTQWYRSLIQSARDSLTPPRLPPLEVTSKPVAVKEIWGLYGNQKKSFAMSFGVQVALVVMMVLALSTKPVQRVVKNTVAVFLPDAPVDVLKPVMHGGGGGGDRSPLPASKGKLPKPAPRQFVPPAAVINNPTPKLAMDPSILAPSDDNLPNINMPNGDPLSKFRSTSNGTGSGGGIGSGQGGGGSGTGGSVEAGVGGGIGGDIFKAGNGVSKPELIHKVEPEYSEEARKAKFQGVVVLYVVVDQNGNAVAPRVVKGLGLGLDEKALEAVIQWKFKPGYKDGRPVAVAATVEVNFRLL
jgi:periplasmic protein TonB